jgi:hypothetical protein
MRTTIGDGSVSKPQLIWVVTMLLAACATARAAPRLLGTATDPTGVEGLVFDTATYDVTFSLSTFSSTFAGEPGFASDAAGALAKVLEAYGVTALDGGPSAPAGAVYSQYCLDVNPSLAETTTGLPARFMWEVRLSPPVNGRATTVCRSTL